MRRRVQCDALQWLAAGLSVFPLVSAEAHDRGLDNDGVWDYGRGGIDRDVEADHPGNPRPDHCTQGAEEGAGNWDVYRDLRREVCINGEESSASVCERLPAAG